MSDIVERLRKHKTRLFHNALDDIAFDVDKAADEIERLSHFWWRHQKCRHLVKTLLANGEKLEAENERLRKRLEIIGDSPFPKDFDALDLAVERNKAYLKENERLREFLERGGIDSSAVLAGEDTGTWQDENERLRAALNDAVQVLRDTGYGPGYTAYTILVKALNQSEQDDGSKHRSPGE